MSERVWHEPEWENVKGIGDHLESIRLKMEKQNAALQIAEKALADNLPISDANMPDEGVRKVFLDEASIREARAALSAVREALRP